MEKRFPFFSKIKMVLRLCTKKLSIDPVVLEAQGHKSLSEAVAHLLNPYADCIRVSFRDLLKTPRKRENEMSRDTP